jgi:hypothetical protein
MYVICTGSAGKHPLSQSARSLPNNNVCVSRVQAQLASILGHGPQVPLGGGKVEVIPPAAKEEYESEEGSEDEEDDERPLTREELKIKTLRNLAKRETVDKDGDRRPGRRKNVKMASSS